VIDTPAALHHEGDSLVHRLAPEAKVGATIAFVLAVVATPREAVLAFVLHLAVVLAVIAAAALPVSLVLRRLRIELPFLAFALLLPFVAEDGVWAAWNIVAKGTLGVLAAIVLASTTPIAELLAGLERLRVPRVLVAIAGFMARYLDVIAGEASRMRIARLSRGDDPRWLWQARGFAAASGTLFVRAYERGERVHLAMCSRGYDGSMPVVHHHPAPPRSWLLAAAPPAAATAVMLGAWVVA
jgi:cobalt/nickel transport system permease protein